MLYLHMKIINSVANETAEIITTNQEILQIC